MGHPTIRGRGAALNPKNRFHEIEVERDEWVEAEDPAPRTRFYRDPTRTIIATNDSPDVGFEASINPYRGCEHGCIYCFARPFHEYLDLSPGVDFETKIFVKEDAPELLRKELSAKSWEPKFVLMSGVTDPYQPVERRLEITRRCLEVLAEFRNPVGVITKSDLVTRDIDVLSELARHNAVCATLSITTLSKELKRVMEPRAALPEKRFEAIRRLSDAGIPDRRQRRSSHPRSHRPRDAGDSRARGRGGCRQRGVDHAAPAARREGSVRGLARAPFPGPQREGPEPASRLARRRSLRSRAGARACEATGRSRSRCGRCSTCRAGSTA